MTRLIRLTGLALVCLVMTACVGVIPQGRAPTPIHAGMTMTDVMGAWGPSTSCNRVYGAPNQDTVCLYYDSARVIAGTRSYTRRSYKSVYYRNGAVVDWQHH